MAMKEARVQQLEWQLLESSRLDAEAIAGQPLPSPDRDVAWQFLPAAAQGIAGQALPAPDQGMHVSDGPDGAEPTQSQPHLDHRPGNRLDLFALHDVCLPGRLHGAARLAACHFCMYVLHTVLRRICHVSRQHTSHSSAPCPHHRATQPNYTGRQSFACDQIPFLSLLYALLKSSLPRCILPILPLPVLS